MIKREFISSSSRRQLPLKYSENIECLAKIDQKVIFLNFVFRRLKPPWPIISAAQFKVKYLESYTVVCSSMQKDRSLFFELLTTRKNVKIKVNDDAKMEESENKWEKN